MKFILSKVISFEKNNFICKQISTENTYKLQVKNLNLVNKIKNSLGEYILILEINKNNTVSIANRKNARKLYSELSKLESFKKYAKMVLPETDYILFKKYFSESYNIILLKEKIPDIILFLEKSLEKEIGSKQFTFYYKSYGSTPFFELKKVFSNLLLNYDITITYLGGHSYKFSSKDTDFLIVKKTLEDILCIKGELMFL